MTTNRSAWMGLTAAWGLSFASVLAAEVPSGAGLVETVVRATQQFRDPEEAIAAQYVPANACVSGPQEGAMGEHFIKGALVFDGQLDPQQPEALIYEQRTGKARLVGVEYIVIAEAWHTNNGEATPALMGQLMHYVGSPNRYGLPPFYELHVWAWKFNPSGMFVDWNPKVSCAEFKPEPAAPAAAQGHGHGSHGPGAPSPGRHAAATPGIAR